MIDTIDFEDYIDTLIADKESEEIEFKSAKGGFPRSFWETYSAFANTEGGTIVLGVKEKNGSFSSDNLTEETVVKYKKVFWDNVNNPNTISRCLLKNSDVKTIKYQDSWLLLFYIPMADRTERPVYRTQNAKNGTYKRGYEGDYLCASNEVNRMFADADITTPPDSRILTGFSMDDIDNESMQQYRQLFNLSNPNHPWNVLTDFEFLRKLGGYRTDRKTGKEGFTLAGILMLGKTHAITDNECVPNFFLDYRHYDDEQTLKGRWIDRVYPDGTWEANLFQFYRRIAPKLYKFVPAPFVLSGDTRIDESEAQVSLREAFINSLIHADYSVNASLSILKYSNQIVFSNPGTLLISRQQYYKGGESVCRNKALQTMFMMLGKAEKAGSGVDKILKGWEKQYWKKPSLSFKYQPDKVELSMSIESLLSNDIRMGLIKLFGEKINGLDYQALITLATAYSQSEISNETIRPLLAIHRISVTILLKQLCEHGFLVATGRGRGTKYHLNRQEASADIASLDANIASTKANIASLDANIASTDANIASSKQIKIGKRTKPEILFKAIAEVCSEYVTLEEIATKTGRSTGYLKDRIIPEMLRLHIIERLFPEAPTNPHQKYRRI